MAMNNSENDGVQDIKPASLLDALIPLIVLIALLVFSVQIYGNDSSYGPNQIALLFVTGIALIIALKNGHRWPTLEQAIVSGLSISLNALLILLTVGALIGTWLLSGTVPTLIYYGIQLIDPNWFYATSCILCAIVAASIGSSWTTAATVGVALIGIANGLGLNEAISAGAIVSGAYFGDKLSPLSDTTNLAPAVAGADLFEHIQHMLWTSVPSLAIALVLFVILGFNHTAVPNTEQIQTMSDLLQSNFNIGIEMLVPLIILFLLAIKKMPAFPAVAIGALIGAVWAIIFQQTLIQAQLDPTLSQTTAMFKVVWSAFFEGFTVHTGNATMDKLLSGGGMANMLNTAWLMLMALMFGAVMEKAGLLSVLVFGILKFAKSTGSLIASTIATCIGTNMITADQYIAIVMPGRMFKHEYEARQLASVSLSRSIEDGGTITSPLIPWNTCGAFMHSVLLVNPLDYAMYAFFNIINPILAIVYAYFGIKVLRLTPPTEQ